MNKVMKNSDRMQSYPQNQQVSMIKTPEKKKTSQRRKHDEISPAAFEDCLISWASTSPNQVFTGVFIPDIKHTNSTLDEVSQLSTSVRFRVSQTNLNQNNSNLILGAKSIQTISTPKISFR